MTASELERRIGDTFGGLADTEVPRGIGFTRGKVRDVFDLGDTLLIVTTDRISAFDRVLTTIPCKGEVLNRVANHWFGNTGDIIPNHILEEVSPRSIMVMKCDVLPVEVVVRGYLTGSAWRAYRAGKAVSGIELPKGMASDQRFDRPLLTPSTKAEQGAHDEPLPSEEVVRRGLVPEELWSRVTNAAMALFARGTEMAAANGLILVDTKYEFGISDGNLYLIDEVHTPDSSRFWYADTYRELFEAGRQQRILDKEYLRQWLMDKGYMGDGEPPVIPDDVKAETAHRYVTAYETITGTVFVSESNGPEAEREKILSLLTKR